MAQFSFSVPISKRNTQRSVPRRSTIRGDKILSSSTASVVSLSRPLTYTRDRKEVQRLVVPATTQLGSVSTTGVLIDLYSAIAQGDDLNMRTGRSIQALSYNLFGTLVGGQANIATDDKVNTVRIVFLEANVGTAVSALNTAWGVVYPADPRYAPGVVRVLRDELLTLTTPGADSTGYLPSALSVNMSGSYNKRLYYTSTSAASISGTSLFLFMVSDSAVAANPGFTCGNWSVTWTD